jgi:peptidyl-prolyl cis-trans isomerase C
MPSTAHPLQKTSEVSPGIFRFKRFAEDFRSLLLILILGLSACSSPLVGTASTPTVPIPTLTPAPPTATPPPSAAVVNGEYITLVEFEAELGRYQAAQAALGRTASDEESRKAVLDDLIAQVLLAQAARAENFTITESDLQSRLDGLASQSGGAEALVNWEADHGYTEDSFRAALKQSAEAAWMRDKIIANVPVTADQVHIQQILTYNEVDARQVLEQLKGGADFAKLAALYDPVTRGELGWVPRGYLLDAAVDEAAFNLAVGAYSDVIATPAGFHIIMVLERGEHTLSPDALLTLQELALVDWVRQQREKSEITILQ